MSTFFTLLFIMSAVGIWFFSKKQPNKKNRNIAIALTIISFLLVGLTGNVDKKEKKEAVSKTIESTSKSKEDNAVPKEIALSLDASEIESDTNGEAIIKGTTEPGAKVTVGLGVVGDSAESDTEGNFSLKYKLSGDKDKDLTINSTLDQGTASAKVRIKQNPEIVKQNAMEKEANEVKDSNDKKEEEISDITQLAEVPTINQAITLQTLADQQFDATYPIKGSKMHSVLGILQDWTKNGDTWFYKVEGTIVNAFGAERNANIEVTITPTGPDSGIVDIIDY